MKHKAFDFLNNLARLINHKEPAFSDGNQIWKEYEGYIRNEMMNQNIKNWDQFLITNYSPRLHPLILDMKDKLFLFTKEYLESKNVVFDDSLIDEQKIWRFWSHDIGDLFSQTLDEDKSLVKSVLSDLSPSHWAYKLNNSNQATGLVFADPKMLELIKVFIQDENKDSEKFFHKLKTLYHLENLIRLWISSNFAPERGKLEIQMFGILETLDLNQDVFGEWEANIFWNEFSKVQDLYAVLERELFQEFELDKLMTFDANTDSLPKDFSLTSEEIYCVVSDTVLAYSKLKMQKDKLSYWDYEFSLNQIILNLEKVMSFEQSLRLLELVENYIVDMEILHLFYQRSNLKDQKIILMDTLQHQFSKVFDVFYTQYYQIS